MSSRCIKGRKQENREVLSLPPKRHCGRQIAFPYSFARINKWRLGPSLGGYRSVAQSVALRSCACHWLVLFTYRLFSFLEILERSRKNKNHGGVLNDHWRRGLGWVNKIYFLFFSQTSRPIIKEKKKKSAGDPKHIFLAAT